MTIEAIESNSNPYIRNELLCFAIALAVYGIVRIYSETAENFKKIGQLLLVGNKTELQEQPPLQHFLKNEKFIPRPDQQNREVSLLTSRNIPEIEAVVRATTQVIRPRPIRANFIV